MRLPRGWTRPAMTYAAGLVLLAPLLACSSDPASPSADPSPGTTVPTGATSDPTDQSAGDPTDGTSDGTSEDPADPTADPEPQEALPPVRDPQSLPALMRETVRGGGLRTTAQLAETDRWTGYAAAYRVNGATVTGELLVPKGRGPFPALVLNHGYIDPAIYTLGRGMSREQEWFAAAGFVVLHTDYRGHAGSDPVSPMGRETRLVYTRDAIGAVKALKRMDYVDADRTAFVGRSMGGGVTLNAIVAEPDLVDAAVVFASVSSRFVDNLRQFTEPNRPDGARAFYDEHGTPGESPRFYRDLSSRTFFDRVEVPVMLHHGTSDDTCPPAWSRQTDRLLREAGARSTLVEWPGEGHAFGPRFADSMRRTVAFLRRHLDV
ncbi:MAG: alpha/beta fold hydrolase [Actinomycetota bacterium]|nr:alpha/beta fold hydrolase [Actinomycetota bacterium]